MPVGPPPMMAAFLPEIVSGLPDGGHEGLVALLGRHQLGVADLHGLLVEIAGTLVLAAVRADGAREERQGVLLGDELQGRAVQPLRHSSTYSGMSCSMGQPPLQGAVKQSIQGTFFSLLRLGRGLMGLTW